MRVLAPAKLNLFLAVGPADARGWHPLRTVFQAISLADEIEIQRSDRLEVTFDDPRVPPENSVSRAVRLLQEVADYPPVRVHVTKGIPMESGLGGGSSDGAAILRSAHRLMRGKLPAHEERALYRSLGADASFFAVGGRARGEGYGEKLTPLEDVPEQWYVLARPDVGCPTPAMYRALDAMSYPFAEFGQELYNDFERVCPAECLSLIASLRNQGLAAGLTGSGSVVFALAPDEASAREIAGRVDAPWVRVARALTRAESLAIED